MINLNEVGAFVSAITNLGVNVRFGVYLPSISVANGYELLVRVIHKDDRFNPDIPPLDFPLQPVSGSANNRWEANINIPVKPGTHFGQPGTYLYRYQLLQNKTVITSWFTDPFAKTTDIGELSAFVTPDFVPDFVWTDDNWKTPELEDLVVYELHVEEFNSTFDGVVERLPYLKSLGVTCLELMPVTSLKLDFDWGYGPLHYFAPNERWGGIQGLKRLVNACHNAGVAVILDVVYQHVDYSFPYHLIYKNAGITSPMIGNNGPFGPEIDFNQEFARDYIQAANFHWLDEYHVDGFRYDEVTDLYDGATGIKYAKIAYDNYTKSLQIPRFTPSGGVKNGEYSRIIQVPEALNQPQTILTNTYSNGTWQDGLLNKAEDMAKRNYVDSSFLNQLDTRIIGYPVTKTVQDIIQQPVEMPVAPFQYLESHDHSQLIYFVGTEAGTTDPDNIPFGDRSKYYKLQPFAIALYTCQGIPMLWQGQEFAENYFLPNNGNGRIRLRRDVHWEYFYDEFGASLVRLYRTLGKLRHTYPALRSRDSYNYNAQSNNQVVAYRRESRAADQIALVFLNFSDQKQSISIPFSKAGTYQEMIDDSLRSAPLKISVSRDDELIKVDVPSNYGYIFIKSTP
ncbi:MAG: alpha-amylase family glycosyl hydrolase [Nostoc sp.]|uniref:alpha-amylase family glycosyl hydrolase n=1 Tax=Nostoc sp. TaxID=1180 RepID=UPI002FF5FBF0